jgi:O-antigen/teichoic acid export membrane protein
VLLQVATNLLSLAKVFILANYFFLEDLGIITIALMMMDIMSIFSETGFDVALIQKKGNIREYLDTAWTAGLIKGIFLFIILFSIAPYLASIRVSQDKVDTTISVLRAMGFCFLLGGIRNIGTVFFQKDMNFRKVFLFNLVFTLTDILLAITFVFIFRSIWGVISARIIAAAASSFSSYILSSYRPRLRFETARIRELWGYGKWIYGINVTAYLISQGDKYFVWPYLGVSQLPLYKYACDLSLTPAAFINNIISSVSFPAYSKIQNDIPRLCEAYLKVLKVAAVLFVPATFLIILFGPYFVKLFLPERMHSMIFALQLLAFRGFTMTFNGTIDSIYRSVGKPKITWIMIMCFLPIQVIGIYPCTKWWGINGTALMAVIPAFCILPVNIVILSRILKCSAAKIVHSILLPTAAAAVMMAVLLLIKYILLPQVNYFALGVLGILSIGFYGAGLWLLDGLFKQGIRELIVEQYQKIKQRLSYSLN